MPKLPSPHGSVVRGSEFPRRSRTFEGRFGRMFRNLPPARFKETDLLALGKKMVSTRRLFAEDEDNPEESTIPAGYTYLGQFIDHDLTFDPVSSLQRDNDPEALVNFRTPRFDLDCVYGRGPADQPYLYEGDGVHLVLGELLNNKKDPDLPRVKSTEFAIIGDPRNDENVIISQLHGIFLRFHNRLADELKTDFATVQQSVRWHYQWVVLHDFLPRLVNKKTYDAVLPHIADNCDPLDHPPKLLFYRVRDQAFIPVEFSAAAYRFGHSMVRRRYRLNRSDIPGVGGPFDVIGPDQKLDLRGFRIFNPDWAIEWDLFFDGIATAVQQPLTKNRVQPAHKIDTALVKPLARLPFSFTRDRRHSLPQRNLVRGWRFSLPSGQAVSYAMGKDPLPDDALTVGRATKNRPAPLLKDVFPAFSGNAPLWYYVLAEAQHECGGNQLGAVGGRIVMETFVGLMMEDGHSFLRQNPLWKPGNVKNGGKFGMAEFIKKAIGPP